MQSSVPELVDISKEPDSVHEMYGTEPGKKSFANNCLLARRLVERGVRFVQLYHRGWDNHGTIQPRRHRQPAASPVPGDGSGRGRAHAGFKTARPAGLARWWSGAASSAARP